jgi:hypothetical protein
MHEKHQKHEKIFKHENYKKHDKECIVLFTSIMKVYSLNSSNVCITLVACLDIIMCKNQMESLQMVDN